MEKEQFYSKGKFFDSFDELLEFERKWPNMQLDLVEYKKFLDERYKEAEMNLKLRGSFTNKEAYSILAANLLPYGEDCHWKIVKVQNNV